MNKELLNEVFDLRNGEMVNKYNKTVKIVYIDPMTSENIFPYRDQIKSFGARWDNAKKRWYWVTGKNYKKVYDEQIKPCLEYLSSVETTDDGQKRDVIKIIDELIAECEKSMSEESLSNDIKSRLLSFKQDLINAVSSEEFKKLIGPVIKFRSAYGRGFSIANTILIYLQKPNAVMVKSRSNWRAANRDIKPGELPICLFVPSGFKRKPNALEKERITNGFLSTYGVSNVKQLTVTQREELKFELNKIEHENISGFKLEPSFFDYSQTVQMAGKEDMVGDPNAEVDWYDKSGMHDEKTEMLCDSLVKAITNIAGIEVKFVPEATLNGALGIAKGGVIEVVEGVKTLNMFNALIHEYAHELLHQKYLNLNNSELGSYFIKTRPGRAAREQQAELCAWVVLKNYGYDLNESLNYTGIWGLNEKNASDVFDIVLNVSEVIVKQIDTMLDDGKETLSESLVNEGVTILNNGYELADAVGLGDVYRKSYLMKHRKKGAMLEHITRQVMNLLEIKKTDA